MRKVEDHRAELWEATKGFTIGGKGEESTSRCGRSLELAGASRPDLASLTASVQQSIANGSVADTAKANHAVAKHEITEELQSLSTPYPFIL